MRPLILSLRPQYADLVFKGIKKVELRRRIFPKVNNCLVFIYVSSPVMELRGGFQVGKVWSGPPEEVWQSVYELAGIARPAFDAYFDGQSIAHALEIRDVWVYENPVGLSDLRDLFGGFVAPQSWRYVKAEEHKALHKMRRRTGKLPMTVSLRT